MRKYYLLMIFVVFGVECLQVIDKLVSSTWPDQLEVTVGIFSVKTAGRDEYLSISNERGGVILSCSLGISGTTRCFSEEQLQALTGKRVTAHWYRQSVYGGLRKNKLVALEDESKIIRNPERTKLLDQSNIKISAIVGSVVVAIMFIVWSLIILRQNGRLKDVGT